MRIKPFPIIYFTNTAVVEKVIVCFVSIPVASNTQTDLPCEPWFGSGGGAEIFVHLEKEAFTDFHSFNIECFLMFAHSLWFNVLACVN